MESECLKKTMYLLEKLKQADEKIHEQEEELKNLQTNSLKTKQKSDQLLNKKEEEFRVRIHTDYKKHVN